ncbi:hypothetical protein [Streptomyces sp. DSM 40907]|uniref:hypothetical protein n=1 Tax=Streptomyces kutzneri TaxID=3051179 RepID=UPI0028D4D08E|nr:hypothetical protein [Streptomyces sp. DSM 40907]
MPTELLIGLVSSGAGLIGVLLGIGGALFGARMQARGSHAQADATRTAAETTAHTQYAATLVQQNRAAQRNAYVEFLRNLHALSAEASQARDPHDSMSTIETLRGRAERMRASYTLVELEGPDYVLAAAHEVMLRGSTLASSSSRLRDTLRAEGRLLEASLIGSSAAVNARRRLADLRNALSCLPVEERSRLVLQAGDPRTYVSMGADAHYGGAHERAEEALDQLVSDGILATEATFALLIDAGMRHEAATELIALEHDIFDTAVVTFITVVRRHLNDTNPTLYIVDPEADL